MYDDYFGGGDHAFSNRRFYGVCNHWREPVRVGRYVVTCSGMLHHGKGLGKKRDATPDFGIYLSIGWREELGKSWTNGAYLKRLALARPYPAMAMDWRDGTALKAEELNELVEICRSKIRRGKSIDIGCTMGHGRTGTLLACLIARVEHLSAEEAIAAARERYCKSAVEGKSQEESVAGYVALYGIKRRR